MADELAEVGTVPERHEPGPGRFAAMAIAAGLGGIGAIKLMGTGTHIHPGHPAGGLRLGPVPGAIGPAGGGAMPATHGSAYDLTSASLGGTAAAHAQHAATLYGGAGPLTTGSTWRTGPATATGPAQNTWMSSAAPAHNAGLSSAAPAQSAWASSAAPAQNTWASSAAPAQHAGPTSAVPASSPQPGHASPTGSPAGQVGPTGLPATGPPGSPGGYSPPVVTSGYAPSHAATPEEIQAQMLSMTPEDRRKFILDMMHQNNMNLTPAELAYQPDLPPSFWDKPTYNLNGQTLNVASAAATAYAIAGQLGVNISDLGTFASHLDDLSNKLLGYIGPLYDAVNRANGVFEGDSDLTSQLDSGNSTEDTSFYGHFKAITYPHRDSSFNVVTAISPGEADNVRQTAADYWGAEQTNLAMLGATAKDPRSAMDQARWKWDPTANGGKGGMVDQTGNYPGWYFDTGDPRSPFYQKH